LLCELAGAGADYVVAVVVAIGLRDRCELEQGAELGFFEGWGEVGEVLEGRLSNFR